MHILIIIHFIFYLNIYTLVVHISKGRKVFIVKVSLYPVLPPHLVPFPRGTTVPWILYVHPESDSGHLQASLCHLFSFSFLYKWWHLMHTFLHLAFFISQYILQVIPHQDLESILPLFTAVYSSIAWMYSDLLNPFSVYRHLSWLWSFKILMFYPGKFKCNEHLWAHHPALTWDHACFICTPSANSPLPCIILKQIPDILSFHL